MRDGDRGGAAIAVAVLVATAMVFAWAGVARAREPRARRLVPTRDAPEGLAAEAPGGRASLGEAAAVDTYCIVWYDFDPFDWQGWTRRDNTAQSDTFFHIDDFSGLDGGTYGRLVPIEGSRSAWCGARPGDDEYLCGWQAAPGYGNGWDQALVTRQVRFRSPLVLSYHGIFDSEPQYDKTTVEYASDGWGDEWTVISTYDGFVDTIATHTLSLALAVTKLRFHFTSDGAWSDQDGLRDTDGACIIDSITVSDDGLFGSNFEDFEPPDLIPHLMFWHFQPGKRGFGMYSGLATNLIDRDPCGENTSAQIVFHEGSPFPSDEYPGLMETPFCQGGGGLEAPCQGEVVRSPLIDMTRYSTACDEVQDADIPPGVLPGLGGTVLRFTIYRDNPLPNLAFYTWRIRPWCEGCPAQWLDREFVYYGAEREYLQMSYDISDLVAGDDPVQVELMMHDMCDAWYMVYGDCAEHTPAPYFDNVRLYRYSTAGPQWYVRRHALFQDTFPEDEEDLESWCRADMAMDINWPFESAIVPGDSAVIICSAPLSGLDTLPTGEPRVYCHVNAQYIGAGTKPDLFGPQLAGDCGRYVSDDGDWTVLLCDSALTPAGGWCWDGYEIDLNDTLFTRGYMIEYYFKAYDLAGIGATCPETAEQPGGDRFEFTCLPTLRADALYVDDFDGIGTFDGLAQLYIEQAWEDVMADPLDRYDVNAPTTCVDNGPGSRATWPQLGAYNSIIWDSGYLSDCTISDGTDYSDKSDDAGLLRDWMRNQGSHQHGLAILGDGVASNLAGSTAPAAVELMEQICGVTLGHGSYFDLTGGIEGGGVANPLITGVSGERFEGLEYHAFGGCPMIDDFDVIDTIGAGVFCLQYPDYGGSPYFAGIRTRQTDDFGQDMWSLWLGHSFMHVRDAHVGVLARNRLLLGIKYCIWGGTSNEDITGDETPPAATTLSRCRPNPFNPATTIAFTLREKGPVTLKVYDVSGRLVKTLVDGTREAGGYEAVWDGRNDGGRSAASGIYFCRMNAAGFERTEKMVLLK